MKGRTRSEKPGRGVSYRAKFSNGKRSAQPKQKAQPPVPRVVRLLALAWKIDGMIRRGEIRNMAEAARIAGVTRARMTQIVNLMLLPPAVQEGLLEASDPTLTERMVRGRIADLAWNR